MQDMFYFLISYLGIFFGSFIFMNFLTNGFVFKFLPVRVSQGKKILIKVHGITNTYFRIGKPGENTVSYKEGKENKVLKVDPEHIQDFLGVKLLETDSVHNAIKKADFTTVEGFDATTFDNLLVRALNMPQMDDKITKLILVLLVVIVIACGIIAFKVITLEQVINAIPKTGVV